MRIISFIVAIVVAVGLYGYVFERDTLIAVLSAGEVETGSGDAGSLTADATAADEPSVDDSLVAVVVRETRSEEIANAVVLRGRTEADRQVEVRAQTSGLVVSQPRLKGSLVSAGDVICQLDEGTRFADLAEARARLAEAEISETAASRLAEGGFGSETRKVSARAALEAASAQVARAETEIDRMEIRAPFDGILETDSAELGSLLQPGAACATIIRLDPIRVVGFLPETDVDKVRTGAVAQARLASGRNISGTVTFISRSSDPDTRTFRVDIAVPNPDLSIRDGQTVEIVIAAEGAAAHLIPPAALTLDNSGTMGLRIVDDTNTTRFVPVQVIRDTTEGFLVTGLPDEARVIVRGQEFVTDGVTVRPVLEGDRS